MSGGPDCLHLHAESLDQVLRQASVVIGIFIDLLQLLVRMPEKH